MKRILITGAAGFIGSEFVYLLSTLSTEFYVVSFDSLTYAGRIKNLDGIEDSRHEFIRGDITEKEEVLAAIGEDCVGIINFAAETHVDRSIVSANEFIRTNVLGTQILLDCAREKGVERFLQVSTDEVFGSLPENSNSLFIEGSPFAPNSPYAASKAAAEHFVRAANKTHGIKTIITRCGNNYGYRQHPEKLIPLAIARALDDQPIPLYGDGKNVRDWIFVTDHCESILRAFIDGKAGEIYNIGARNTKTNIQVVKDILDALNKPKSLITPVKDRLGHDRRYAIDPTKIETELGWNPKVSWEEGLKLTIDWYCENKDWLDQALRSYNSDD